MLVGRYHIFKRQCGNMPSWSLSTGDDILKCVNNESKWNFNNSEKIIPGIIFVQLLINMIYQFSFPITLKSDYSCFRYSNSISWKSENRDFFFLTIRNIISFESSEKKNSRIVFYSILVIEKHVYFHFQKLSSRIIHVFDVLFNFPGGWKSRNISFWLPEEGQFWRLNKNTLETCKNPRPTSGWSELTKSCTTKTMNFHMAYFSWIPQNNARLKLSCKFGESKWNPYWVIVFMSSSDSNYVANDHEDVDKYGSFASPKPSWKFSEPKWNTYWVIMLTSSSGTNHVPNEHEDVDQYGSFTIPSEIMPC